MIARGLRVNLNTDDPAIDQRNLASAYVDVAMIFDFDADRMVELCLNGLEASWMDEADRRGARARFDREIAALRADLEDDAPPDSIPYYRSEEDGW
jgi:adenosine deaminase